MNVGARAVPEPGPDALVADPPPSKTSQCGRRRRRGSFAWLLRSWRWKPCARTRSLLPGLVSLHRAGILHYGESGKRAPSTVRSSSACRQWIYFAERAWRALGFSRSFKATLDRPPGSWLLNVLICLLRGTGPQVVRAIFEAYVLSSMCTTRCRGRCGRLCMALVFCKGG